MSSFFITSHLTERYLHGYFLHDPQYEIIKKHLLKKLNKIDSKNSLESIFKEDIGPYNLLNADLYMELATIYLSKINIKNPSQEQLDFLI